MQTDTHLMPIYDPMPLHVKRAKGVWLYDAAGQAYLDTFSGLGVCPLGHGHPKMLETLNQQSKTLIHSSSCFKHDHNSALAEKLTALTHTDLAFFCNSGAESVETALKIARSYGHEKGISTPAILVFEQSFHGRTLATLSASGFRKSQAGFEPLVGPFVRAPFGDIEAVRKIIAEDRHVVAILVEPIQGAAGIRVPPLHFMPDLRRICDDAGLLLMVDEIQSGLGKTGHFLYTQYANIDADVVMMAKGLANGLPIGACMAKRPYGELLTVGRHGSTFGGNPLCCAVAHTVISTIVDDGYMLQAHRNGERIMTELREKLSDNPYIEEIRGVGSMIGVVCNRPAKDIIPFGLAQGLALNIANQQVIRLLPAFTYDDEQVDLLISRLVLSLNNWVNNLS